MSFAEIEVWLIRVGTDYQLLLRGGEKPHIGCSVLAVPRPSLSGDGTVSCTSSVLNLIGHKDEEICRYLAEYTAKKLCAVTVCSGGFHVDNLSQTQISEVLETVREIAEEI